MIPATSLHTLLHTIVDYAGLFPPAGLAMETAVAAAEALDPAIAGRLADVRSLDEWVPKGSAVVV